MKGKQYTDEFKKEAVKQFTERGCSVSDVAKRLGTTTDSLYLRLKKYGEPGPRQADKAGLTVENARLKADLKRMTMEARSNDWRQVKMGLRFLFRIT
jgi:transposase